MLIKNQQQVKEGIDAVIVDSVLKIRNGLTKHAQAAWPVEEKINGVSNVNSPVVALRSLE